ncbi:MAG: tRNA 2-thiouridine(34) synthase MnmA [Deltaproteobacteria bacterium]|nr:tRNA 2-thiouridine(34) synthase MnmA [Deltaproteobacteria bacterium]
MSGGVDSSVAALLLQRQGWDVVGVTLHLWDYVREGHAGRCCAPEDQYDAARVCEALGVPHYTFDRRALFRETVVAPFLEEYLQGRTPSPCVRCNEGIKFGPLWDLARRLGASHIATGHYARVAPTAEGVDLRRGTDPARDQSYFLWAAPLEALRALVLPVGTYAKDALRAVAWEAGLAVARKPDSTDLCFLEGRSYKEFVQSHGPERVRGGTVETLEGAVLERHAGLHGFTVGQRRGVGPSGAPRYVLRIVPETATVVVGEAAEASTNRVTVSQVRWLAAPTEALEVRLRYRAPTQPARVVRALGPTLELALSNPQRGVAPGQAAVFYDGDRVLGGGWIQ